jgi:hypothetical protein
MRLMRQMAAKVEHGTVRADGPGCFGTSPQASFCFFVGGRWAVGGVKSMFHLHVCKKSGDEGVLGEKCTKIPKVS